jgi:hypothetical protein
MRHRGRENVLLFVVQPSKKSLTNQYVVVYMVYLSISCIHTCNTKCFLKQGILVSRDAFYPALDGFNSFAHDTMPFFAGRLFRLAERPANPSFCLTNEGFPTNHQPLNRDCTSF